MSDAVPRAGVGRWAALACLILILLVLRRPDAVINPQFWAEDGTIYFSGQLHHPGFAVLFETYKGYLPLIPRLVAAFASWFSAAYTPLIYNLCALLLAAFCCSLFSLNHYRYLLRSDALRILLCILAAAAFQSDELIGTLACVHIFLTLGLLLILLQPPEIYADTRTTALAVPGALLSGLTEALVVILVPLALWMILRRRGAARLVPATVLLAAILQVSFFLAIGDPYHTPPDRLGEIAAATLIAVIWRAILVPVLGLSVAQSLSSTDFQLILLLTAIGLTVWLIRLWQPSPFADGRKIAITLYLLFASVVLAISGRSLAKPFAGPITEWRGERYFFLGGCLFAYLVALSIDRWLPQKRIQPWLAAALFLPGIWGNFRTVSFTDYHWQAHAVQVDRWQAGNKVALSIPINPAPWRLELAGAAQPNPLEGALVRCPGHSPEDDKVYVVLQGRKRWVLHLEWFTAHGYRWPQDLQVISAEALEAIPAGAPVE
jgi:hypothetical protein